MPFLTELLGGFDPLGFLASLVRFLIVLGGLVIVHELGHFLAAKWAGVRVREFAVGLGPTVLKKQLGETVYAVRILPLGGFVRMAGMEPTEAGEQDAEEADDERAFHRKPVWKRIVVFAAGPFMNLLFAVVVNAVVISTVVVTVGSVVPGSPAETAGMAAGDRLVMVDGERVVTLEQVVRKIQGSEGRPVEIVVQRGTATRRLVVQPEIDPEQGVPRVGIEMRISVGQVRRSLGESLLLGAQQTWDAVSGLVYTVYLYLTGQARPELAGPLGIYQMTGSFAQGGLVTLLSFVAMLSVSFGVLNLLPIPIMDGGGILLLVIEGLRGRPLSPEARGVAQLVGLSLLLFIMLYATVQDLGRLAADRLTLGM